jgi:hypothetical protein
MDLHRARHHGRLIAIVCALGGVAQANPPSTARARKVAAAWIRAARHGDVPSGSAPAIEIDVQTAACEGAWHADGLRAAARCIAKALDHLRLDRWTSFLVDHDTRRMLSGAMEEYCQLTLFVTVDVAGQVTTVELTEDACEF